MKKIILSVITAIVLIFAAFVIYVSTMDWNGQKDKIANQFFNVTGKKIEFSGPVEFKVFPVPYFKASAVKIYGDPAYNEASTPIVNIKTLQVDLSLIPLLQGKFDVKEMVAIEPEVLVNILPDGKVNWQSVDDFDRTGERIDAVLDSFRIENAKFRVLSESLDLDLKLDSLNALVSAESIFGPYNIEGSYVKDNNPEGFAIILGKFSDAFATSLSFSIRHPKSDSSLRFDGSFFLKNHAVNGSVVIESARIVDFVNSYYTGFKIDKKYEYPLAASLEVNTNRTNINVSNFVVKYGGSVGAGSLNIPLKYSEYGYQQDTDTRSKVEASLNMTDIDILPFVELFKDFTKSNLKKYDLNLGYDVLFDMKALKGFYKNDEIKDLEFSFDILKENINLNKFSVFLPGDTSLDVKGVIYPTKEILTYNLSVNSKTEDLLRVAEWIGYKIPVINNFTYRKANLNSQFMGNMQNVKISPFNFTVDRTSINGEIGVVRGSKPALLIDVDFDNVDFDNYISKLPNEVSAKGKKEELLYSLSKLSFLNNYNLIFKGSLAKGVWQKSPVDSLFVSFSSKDKVLNLENLKISSIKNSTIEASGELKNLGGDLLFSNIKYDISTQDFYSLFNKNDLPDILKDAKDFRKFESKGVFSGSANKISVRSITKVDDTTLAYSGNISNTSSKTSFEGKIDLRNSDFVKMLNNLKINYNPRVLTMGIFRVTADVLGSLDDAKLKKLEFYIGNNKFNGEMHYKKVAGKNNFNVDLSVNNFEMDRFFYNNANVSSSNFGSKENVEADFLTKPSFNKMKIDYSVANLYNVNGKMKIETLSYGDDYDFKDVTFDLRLNNSILNIDNFKSKLKEAEVNGALSANLNENYAVKGSIFLTDYNLKGNDFFGKKYAIIGGVLSKATFIFKSSIETTEDFVSNLTGSLDLSVAQPVVKGLNFNSIYNLIADKKTGEGFDAAVAKNLEDGETLFNSLEAKIVLSNSLYSIEDMKFINENFDLISSGSGSLMLWDVNMVNRLSFKNLEAPMTITYDMIGSLVSPKLLSDASMVEEYFKQKADDLEAEKKAAEEARQASLKGQIDELSNELFEIKYLVEDKLIKVLSTKDMTSSSEYFKNQYQALLGDSEKLNDKLAEGAKIVDKTVYEEQDVEQVKDINISSRKEYDRLEKEIKDVYYKDIKEQTNNKYNGLASKYNATRADLSRFRDEFLKFPARMIVMGKGFIVEDYPDINDLKKQVDEIFMEIDAQNTIASKDYIMVQTLLDVKETKSYYEKADKMIENYEKKESILKEVMANLLEKLEETISAEEAKFDDMVERKNKEVVIEESKGSISTSSGKTILIEKDIKDIREKEKEILEENIPVLDFSKKSSEDVKKPVKILSREEIKEKINKNVDSGFLKEIDGDKIEVKGVINKL